MDTFVGALVGLAAALAVTHPERRLPAGARPLAAPERARERSARLLTGPRPAPRRA
ncbi:hypothetical protein [Streptomyces cinereospinus]|uniref:Uncharacterized protein n=1 Tax=Streptomyces cinereospinus TaxID=285561 RepID=A0ABV5NBI3_9ACTN